MLSAVFSALVCQNCRALSRITKRTRIDAVQQTIKDHNLLLDLGQVTNKKLVIETGNSICAFIKQKPRRVRSFGCGKHGSRIDYVGTSYQSHGIYHNHSR